MEMHHEAGFRERISCPLMSAAAPLRLAAPHGEADQDWLRQRLEELERIDRPSASEGERQAAEWLVGEFASLGAAARIETESAHGTYWWPIGIGTALGAAGGLAARRGKRLTGALLGAAGAAHVIVTTVAATSAAPGGGTTAATTAPDSHQAIERI